MRIYLLLVSLLYLNGCSNEEYDSVSVSASASARLEADGEVVIDENPQLSDEQKRRFEDRLELEKMYKMERPEGLSEYTLKEVIDINMLELNNGKILTLEGVCGIKEYDEYADSWKSKGFLKSSVQSLLNLHVEHLNRLIDKDKIVYKLSDSGKAYVWLLDYSMMEEGLAVTSPSSSLLNETIISSGFTISISTQDYDMNEKYQALESFARKANAGVWAKR